MLPDWPIDVVSRLEMHSGEAVAHACPFCFYLDGDYICWERAERYSWLCIGCEGWASYTMHKGTDCTFCDLQTPGQMRRYGSKSDQSSIEASRWMALWFLLFQEPVDPFF